jgi:hypothetical protein
MARESLLWVFPARWDAVLAPDHSQPSTGKTKPQSPVLIIVGVIGHLLAKFSVPPVLRGSVHRTHNALRGNPRNSRHVP